ncbi:hypothetical protein ACHAWU_005457 [Discostella pseudostelligera]|uniref:Calmodulin n=1 Tax=Discostella pseudostelligera TaxID=259834 RepID=A0ABD3MXE8_9STRA
MGNESSKSSNSNRMAVSAVAHMMRITKPQLLALRDKCLSVSDTGASSGCYRLTRLSFANAMLEMNVAYEPDYQIMEKLFVMWDIDGVGWVDPLEFFAGLGPLASVMDVATKLQFSLEVYDHEKTGRLNRDDLMTVLSAINTTSSYLGDAVLRRSQIRRIVNDQFEDEYEDAEESLMICTENVLKMTSHPLMFAFTAGAGTARYGTAQ